MPRTASCKFCHQGGLAWDKAYNAETGQWRLIPYADVTAPASVREAHVHNCRTAGQATAPATSAPVTVPMAQAVADAVADAMAAGQVGAPGIAVIPMGANNPPIILTAPAPGAMAPAPAPSIPVGPAPAPMPSIYDDIADAFDAFDREAAGQDSETAESDGPDAETADGDQAEAPITAPAAYSVPAITRTGIDADSITADIPARDPHYLIDKVYADAIRTVIARVDRTGIPANIGLYGPAGTGKTTLGLQIGAWRNAPTFVIEAASRQTADEWYGETVKVNGEWVYVPSALIVGIETPNAVVVINDVALLQSAKVQNGLNEVLDPSTRSVYVRALGRRVHVAPGVIIVGTWNVGDQFTGATALSEQIMDRFRAGVLCELPYPSTDTMAKIIRARTGITAPVAKNLARVADWLRSDSAPITVTTRGLIAAGELIRDGMRLGHALYVSALADLEESERARAYMIIDQHLRTVDTDSADFEAWVSPTLGTYEALCIDAADAAGTSGQGAAS